MKVKKGDFGYIHGQKIRRGLLTLGLFALPLAAFIGGVLVTGTKKNIITVVAMVGCLPACRALVSAIVMWMQKPMDKEIYQKIQKHTGGLVMSYEMYLTTYEKSVFVESFAICGNKVVGYSSRMDGSPQFIEQHVKKILKQNGYKTDVKVLKELNQYLERLDYLNAHKEELTKDIVFEPDSRYPDLSREELIKHTILAISL
ncbi:MAG: hypothetical protein KH828_07150 [Clostridiales bacterium]|nr:hypothetical protein [Clostridiales bacterium]